MREGEDGGEREGKGERGEKFAPKHPLTNFRRGETTIVLETAMGWTAAAALEPIALEGAAVAAASWRAASRAL